MRRDATQLLIAPHNAQVSTKTGQLHLKDEGFEIGDEGFDSIGEIFIDRIEPGHDACAQPAPEGYGENGIWVRGAHDYAQPRVAGAIGSGRYPTMSAWIGEATWVERRIALVDAARQVEEMRAKFWLTEEIDGRWQGVTPEEFRDHIARTIVIGVEQDQDASVRTGPVCGKLDIAFDLARFENAVAPHPDRLGHFGKNSRGRHLGDPSEQDRDGLYLPVSFDNRDDRRHGFRERHRTDRPGRKTLSPNPAPAGAGPSGGARRQ